MAAEGRRKTSLKKESEAGKDFPIWLGVDGLCALLPVFRSHEFDRMEGQGLA